MSAQYAQAKPQGRAAWLPGWVRAWLKGNEVAAIVLWIISCAMTHQAIDEWTNGGGITLFRVHFGLVASALVTQAILTAVELPFWRGNRGLMVARAAVLADTAINAAGLWYAVRGIARTTVWEMLWEMLSSALTMIGLGPVQPAEVGPFLGGVLAFVIGYVLAASPEEVWSKGG